MILQRVQVDEKIKSLYESSNILASIYEAKTKDLTIIFKRGASYTYKNVDSSDYTRFEIAESQGEVFNKYIKKYETTKNDNVDVKRIEDEITNVKNSEINNYKNEIINCLKTIITNWDSNLIFNISDLDKIEVMNNNLKNMVK